MGDQATRADIQGITTTLAALTTQIAALVAVQQPDIRADLPFFTGELTFIDAIKLQLDHARQQEEFFFAKEEKYAKKGYYAEGNQIARDKYYAKSDFYYHKAHFFSKKIRQLEAKLAAEIRRIDEAKSISDPTTVKEDFKEEKLICKIVDDLSVIQVREETKETDPCEVIKSKVYLVGDDFLTPNITASVNSLVESKEVIFDDLLILIDHGEDGVIDEPKKDAIDNIFLFSELVRLPELVVSNNIYSKYFFRRNRVIMQSTTSKTLIYSKYLFKWDGVFQTEPVQAGTKRNSGARHPFTEGIGTRGRVLYKKRRMM